MAVLDFIFSYPCSSVLSTVMWIQCISLPRSHQLLLSGPVFCVPCEEESLKESGTCFPLCGRCLRDGIAMQLLCWRFWLTSVSTMSRYSNLFAVAGKILGNQAEPVTGATCLYNPWLNKFFLTVFMHYRHVLLHTKMMLQLALVLI